MGDGLGYRRWVYTENGSQLVVLRDEKPHPDAIEVPDQHINAIARHPQAFKVQDVPGEERLRVARVPEVRLSLSLETFAADGKDTVEFMVIPELDRFADSKVPDQIRFTVNGQPFAVAPSQVWPLVSARPGIFVFKLVDDRVWAKPDERRAEAK